MATNASDWNTQWLNALAGARTGLSNYEQLAQTRGIDEDNHSQAVALLATSVVQTALLAGLAWTEHDNGAVTLSRARHVLHVAALTLDQIEQQRKSRN